MDKGFLSFRQLLFAFPHDAVIRVYDEAGNVIETHEHTTYSPPFDSKILNAFTSLRIGPRPTRRRPRPPTEATILTLKCYLLAKPIR